MDIFSFSPTTFCALLLTLMRVSLVVFLLPVFGGQSLPNAAKAALCIVFTLAIFPGLSFNGDLFPAHPFMIAVMMLMEGLLGLVLGMCSQFIFIGMQTGGQLIAYQMGLTMMNITDPLTGTQEPLTSHLLYMVALLTFLSLNGHLLMLRAISESFALIPPGGLVVTDILARQVFTLSASMFLIAVKIAAPVMGALFLAELALALMGRAAPQMNIMMLGFPLKIGLGMFFLGLLFTAMADRIREFIVEMGPMFLHLLRAASPFSS